MEYQIIKSEIGESYITAIHESGLKIFIMPKPQFTSVYAIFGTKYGSVDTKFSVNGGKTVEVPEGIAHFLEHKLFESEDGDAFSKYAKTGASANAFTSFDRTCYLFGCSESFEENLGILLDFVQHPYFTAETVKKEQGIIGQEIQMYDDSPGWCVLFNMLESMYEKNPVRIDIAGTKESISQITDKLLYDCYNTFYNLSNMYICISGNVEVEKTISLIEKGLLPAKSVQIERGTFEESDAVTRTYVEKQMEVSIPLFNYGYKIHCSSSLKTLKEKIHMGAALDCLAGDFSPLYRDLTDSGYINDEFDTEYFTGNYYASVIFSGESQNPKAVKEKIDREVERIILEGIDAETVESVKKSMYGDSVRRFNRVSEMTMQLVECAMTGDGLFDELDIIKSITPDDIISALRLLKKENSVLSVINPAV